MTCTHKACGWRVSTRPCDCGCEHDKHRDSGRHGCEGTRYSESAGTFACPCIAYWPAK